MDDIVEIIHSLDIDQVLFWIQTQATNFWWLIGISTFAFIATLIAVPVFVIQIPPDYFSRETRPETAWERQHSVVRTLGVLIKNMLGIILILMGIAMLILPGQGLLTIAVGLMVVDFPGKYRLERWLVSRVSVINGMNLLRKRFGKEPLDFLDRD